MGTSYEYDGQTIGRVAGEDLSSAKNRFVKIESGTGDVILPTSAGDDVIGVTQTNPGDQENVSIQIDGAPKVEAGGSVTRSDDIATDADGKAVTATSSDQIVGEAFENASSGDLIPVNLDKDGDAA